MKHFLKVADADVMPLLLELQRAPELWNAHRERKDTEGTPHAMMDDIWVRWAQHKRDFTRMHFPIWYPAFYRLPALRPIIFGLMARVEATHLGGILITRIPPGARILPHADLAWHPIHYNTKLYVVLETNPEVTFHVEDEVVVMNQGEVWRIDNTKVHEISNAGDTERSTLIICLKCET